MKRLWTLLLVLLSIVSSSVFAGGSITTVATVTSETQTKGYAGLVWTLGGKKSDAIPDLVVGVRSLKVKSNDQVSNGADLSARFSFSNGFTFDNLRLSYVGGNRNLLGNLGAGYSFINSAFFGALAAQGPYSRAGLEYEFNARKFTPSLELLTINKPEKVSGGLTTTD